MKNITDNKNAVTYTLEAIIGISLIIGTVIFVTSNTPFTAQKTGEHSKVQLVNIGRDVLDLVELTPITDIFGNYSKSQGVNRTYTLIADKTMVFPGENINFTVYYLDTNNMVTVTLDLYESTLGSSFDYKNSWTDITGYKTMNLSSPGEYSIIAANPTDSADPTRYSNAVTILVGDYFLDTDVNGIFSSGDRNISGIVSYSNRSGAPNLTIQILTNDGKTEIVNFIDNKTSDIRIVEDFESTNNWINNH